MNLITYPKPTTMLIALSSREHPCIINMRGYVTRAVLLAVGLGGLILLSKSIDLGENGKRCFYALRKYFPRGKEKDGGRSPATTTGYNNETCPICLGCPKTGVRAPCGHLICAKCLARYCEVRSTNEPPCPLCRAPVKSITLAIADVTEDKLADSIITKIKSKRYMKNVEYQDKETRRSLLDHVESDQISLNNGGDYLARNFITWCFVMILLFSMRLQILPWFEFFDGYETVLDFLLPLVVVVPTIYIFCIMYPNGLTMLKR